MVICANNHIPPIFNRNTVAVLVGKFEAIVVRGFYLWGGMKPGFLEDVAVDFEFGRRVIYPNPETGTGRIE